MQQEGVEWRERFKDRGTVWVHTQGYQLDVQRTQRRRRNIWEAVGIGQTARFWGRIMEGTAVCLRRSNPYCPTNDRPVVHLWSSGESSPVGQIPNVAVL